MEWYVNATRVAWSPVIVTDQGMPLRDVIPFPEPGLFWARTWDDDSGRWLRCIFKEAPSERAHAAKRVAAGARVGGQRHAEPTLPLTCPWHDGIAQHEAFMRFWKERAHEHVTEEEWPLPGCRTASDLRQVVQQALEVTVRGGA